MYVSSFSFSQMILFCTLMLMLPCSPVYFHVAFFSFLSMVCSSSGDDVMMVSCASLSRYFSWHVSVFVISFLQSIHVYWYENSSVTFCWFVSSGMVNCISFFDAHCTVRCALMCIIEE